MHNKYSKRGDIFLYTTVCISLKIILQHGIKVMDGKLRGKVNNRENHTCKLMKKKIPGTNGQI